MFSLIIFFFFKLNCIFSQIIIPFTTINENKNNTAPYYISSFMYASYPSQVITQIKIGTPGQKIDLLIKTLRVYISINSVQMGTYHITRFNESNSTTYIPLSDKSYNYGQPDFTFAIKSKELIKFGNNLTLENFSFILGTEDYSINTNKETGVLGLQIGDSDWRVKDVNLIKQLKERNLIRNYSYYISYEDKYPYNARMNGNLIIGVFPHEQNPKKYNKKNFREFYGEIVGGGLGFKIKEASYGKTEIHSDFKAQLAIEDNLIRGTKIFMDVLKEKFFQKNIDAKLCTQSKFSHYDDKDLIYFYCENRTKIDKFKNIILKVDNFGIDENGNENDNNTNLIIELTYKDLFTEYDGKYFFLMYFPERNYETDYFRLSKVVFQKYLLNFNLETKKIGFYINDTGINDKNETDDKNYDISFEKLLPWILVGVLIFVVLILIWFIIYINVCKKRKKRANELMDDNYTYDEGSSQF